MKKCLVLLAVLAMAGVASGAAIIPSTHDIESLTPGISVHGQGGFEAGKTYGTIAGNVVAGGPAGAQAIGGSYGPDFGGAAMQIVGGTGVVDITLDFGDKWRKEFSIEGDGQWGNGTNYFQLLIYQNSYSAYDPIWGIQGNGLSKEKTWDPGSLPPANWCELHVHSDIAANTLLVELYDIDDSLGTRIGGPTHIVYNGPSPFATSLDVIEFGNWYPTAAFDNLVITPEPVTLSLLALGGGLLALLRRRR